MHRPNPQPVHLLRVISRFNQSVHRLRSAVARGPAHARRAFSLADPEALRGTLIAVPFINAEGMRTGHRYLTDRRDLNRAFPGREGGSIASLIANAVTGTILPHCEFVVDLLRFQKEEIEHGVEGVMNVMAYLGMINGPRRTVPADQVYNKSTWVRAGMEQSGFFFPDAELGDEVKEGDVLGRVVDPITDVEYMINAPRAGKLIGMAVSRPVLSGYGLFHIAWTE